MWLLPAAPLFTRDPLGTFDLADFFFTLDALPDTPSKGFVSSWDGIFCLLDGVNRYTIEPSCVLLMQKVKVLGKIIIIHH